MNNYLDIDWLKANHQMVHYFGLGFIQLKMNHQDRLHFYTSELPPTVPEEDVHNHRYCFTSTILKGYFRQELFRVVEGDTHLREQETCKEGVCAGSTPVSCSLLLASSHLYAVGGQYFIDHDTFHRVEAQNCITLLIRGEYKKELAEVIRLRGQVKVCPFSQKVPTERLWEIIESMVKERTDGE
jgi:hypothetical protein